MLTIFSSLSFYTNLVHLPHETDPIPSEICDNPKRYPFFHDAIGAIDGTHIACAPSEREHAVTRNRKGLLTQNCLIACSFDLRFTYVLSGWEGSAEDVRSYLIMPDRLISQFQMGQIILPMLVSPSALSFWSLTEVSVTIWLTGDAQEYGMFPPLITTIYSNSPARPSNPRELFNLRHASAQNVIEHIFGILKQRFCMVLLAPEYDMDIQARVPPALCTLHNFIHQHDPSDIEDYSDLAEFSHIHADDPGLGDLAMHTLTAAE